MQVSIKWLRDYVDFTETPEELADKLTMAGVPVESIHKADEGLDKVVAGKLLAVKWHEDSDHLRICAVDVGAGEPLTIVTGAPNVAEGQVVPVALVGAHLPCGKKIAKGKMRGVLSCGMLCSADELCLNLDELPEEQKTGIYILPDDTPVGRTAAEALGLDDVVLEFEITANRADCFSVLGIAREVAVLTGKPLKLPAVDAHENAALPPAADLVRIGVADGQLCPRFSARVLRNVRVAPSPEWMRLRLEGAGIRSIDNVVDVTNFVMLELGQPMHAYDWDAVAGHSLTARRAAPGERLHTLDDSSRLAKGGELVIADADKAAGLAGVMGGFETEITAKTTTVVLEAAAFYSASIRRTARACGLHSEASGRFERGVDITQTTTALNRAAQLLAEMGACDVCPGIVDVYPQPVSPQTIRYTARDINAHLGTSLAREAINAILATLGFAVAADGDADIATVPSWRRTDVVRWQDLSEEVARVHGYDSIAATTPRGNIMLARQSERQEFVQRLKAELVRLGLDEVCSTAFMRPEALAKLCVPATSGLARAIPIMNPLTDGAPLLRTTLLPALMDNALRNFARSNDDVRLFEVAPVFFPKALPLTELPTESVKAAAILTGRRAPVAWDNSKDQLDFYDVKGIVEELLAALGVARYSVEAGEHFALHPGKTAVIKKGNEKLGVLGELHPNVLANYDVHKRKLFLFELDVAALRRCAGRATTYQALPRYPAIDRDLAIIVDDGVAVADLERLIKKNAGPCFKAVTLFDLYTGKQIAAHKKSVAFNLRFQSAERTLTDEEADAAFGKIVEALVQACGAELRA